MSEESSRSWTALNPKGSSRTETPRTTGGPRITFFGGKGGVGKTTCAAAAAVRAATEGSRVLVVSTDPAHSLGDALEEKLGAEPTRVKLLRGRRGELFAAQLDADRALSRWLRERDFAIRTIAERGTYLDEEDVDRLMSLSLPGVDELVGLVELVRLSKKRVFDEVVVDTAPTGHTLRLLEMPDTLRRLAQVLDDMHAKHRFLASSLAGSWRADFADAAISEIEAEAQSLRGMLADRARTSFTWVTLAEELPVRESEAGVRGIEALGAHVGAVVVNRAWPPPDRSCALCSPRFDAELEWRRKIARLFAGRRLLEIPAALEEPVGTKALAALATTVRPLDASGSERKGARAEHARARTAEVSASAMPVVAATMRLLLFGGKGGVGKTTCAAAFAIELASARPDKSVLVLSTDPAHSLGDALGAPLGDEARRVAGAPRNLAARELDAKGAFARERERYREAIDDLFSSLFRGAMDATFDRAVLEDLLDLAPPGIDELLALVSILDALVAPRGGAYDLVVVDTAPTGHTMRLLELPPKALEWVHALMSVILKYRSVIGLGELASDLTALARRLRELMALLVDPLRTGFVAVTRPGELPVRETERLAAGLRKMHVALFSIVANAVAASGEGACTRCELASSAERRSLDRLATLAKKHRAPLVLAPAIYPGPRGPAQLRSFARRIGYAAWPR